MRRFLPMVRRAIVILVSLVLGLVALVLLTLVGALLFVRTESGELWLTKTTVSVVNSLSEKTGFKMSIGRLEGPLPSVLLVRDLVLSDPKGTWLVVPEAQVRMDWKALWKFSLTVEQVSVLHPDWERLPQLNLEKGPPSGFNFWKWLENLPRWLPDLEVTNLLVEQATVHQPVFTPAASKTQEGQGRVFGLTAKASALASVSQGLRVELGVLTFVPDSAKNTQQGLSHEALTLTTFLRPDTEFGLALEVHQEAGGLLSQFLPGEPALNVDIQGQAPLRNWQARLSAVAENLAEFEGVVDISLPLETGEHLLSWLASPQSGEDFSLKLTAKAQLGPLAPPLWPVLLGLYQSNPDQPGQSVNLELVAGLSPGAALEFRVPKLELLSPAWSVEATNIVVPMQGNLGGTLRARLEKPELFAPLVALPFEQAWLNLVLGGSLYFPTANLDLGVDNMAVKETASGERMDVHTALQVNLGLPSPTSRQETSCAISGVIALTDVPDVPGNSTENTLKLNMVASKLLVDVREFQLSGLNSQIDLAGIWNVPSGVFSGNTHVGVRDIAGLLQIFAVERDLAGAIDLSVQVLEGDTSGTMHGDASINMEGMRWGVEYLNTMFGENASLSTDLLLMPHFTQARLDNIVVSAGQLSAAGNAQVRQPEAAPADTKPAPQPGPVAKFALADYQAEAQLDINCTDLGIFWEGLSGAAQATVDLSGPLLAPAVTAKASSAEVGLLTESVHKVEVNLNSPKFDFLALTSTGVHGTALATAESRGVPARLQFPWQLNTRMLDFPDIRLAAVGLNAEGRCLLDFSPFFITATLNARVEDWAHIAAYAPVQGQGVHLSAQMARVNPADPQQQIQASWSAEQLSLADALSVDSLAGNLSINDLWKARTYTAATTTAMGHVAGRTWNTSTASVHGDMGASFNAVLEAAIKGELSASASARFADMALHINTLEAADTQTTLAVALRQPTVLRFANGFAVEKLELGLSQAQKPLGLLTVQGTLAASGMDLKANLADLPLVALATFTSFRMPEGTVGASVHLEGSPARPRGNLSLAVKKLSYPQSEFPPVSFSIDGVIEQRTAGPVVQLALQLEDKVVLGVKEAQLLMSVPLAFTANGLPSLPTNRPLQGSLLWQGEVAPLWNFVPLADRRLSGALDLNAKLSGTLAKPHVLANLALNQGEYDDLVLGVMLANINTELQVQSDATSSFTFQASDGVGGTLALSGSLGSLAQDLPLNISGSVNNMKPLRRSDLRISLSGEADVRGTLLSPRLWAKLTVNQGELSLDNLPSSGVRTLDVIEVGSSSASISTSAATETANYVAVEESRGSMQVSVSIPNQFFVRGMGVESEWQGELQVTGAMNKPQLVGKLNSVRGSFDLIGKTFLLSRGIITFTGGNSINPVLDVLVEYKTPGLTAEALVSGTATSPRLTLSSQPARSQEEIIAQVLFGESVRNLSSVQALQLGATVASLTTFGTGGPSIMGTARTLFGLDVLRFGSQDLNTDTTDASGAPAPTVEVGKYVLDNVYVGMEQGLGVDSTGVKVEVDLGYNINLEARATPDKSEVGIEWKLDY